MTHILSLVSLFAYKHTDDSVRGHGWRKHYTVAGATKRRDHNEKHIKQTTQDTDPSSIQRTGARDDQKTYYHQQTVKRLLLPLLLVLLLPFSVYAGVLSSLFQFLGESDVADATAAESVDYSALYTPLLSATVSAKAQGAIGGGDVYAENGALIATGPVGADEIAASSNSGGEISVYVVREGDALSQIAEMYGVTTNTILWANDLPSAESIRPGDTLVILPIVGVQHTVAKGETISSIVKRYGADMDEVLSYNNLSANDTLAVGDTLLIPGGEIDTAKTTRRIASRPQPKKSSGTVSSKAALVHPAPGAIKTQGIHGYNAVDLASPGGVAMPVRAAAAGEVIVSKPSGWNGGYGQYIVVRHPNGTQTLYSHLSRNDVAVGEYVAQGQQIGIMGTTGRSTGVHVHFEVRGGRNPF